MSKGMFASAVDYVAEQESLYIASSTNMVEQHYLQMQPFEAVMRVVKDLPYLNIDHVLAVVDDEEHSEEEAEQEEKEKGKNSAQYYYDTSLFYWIQKTQKLDNKPKLPGEVEFYKCMADLERETDCTSKIDLKETNDLLQQLSASQWFFVLWRLVSSHAGEDVQDFLNLATLYGIQIDPHCFQGTLFVPQPLDSLNKYNAITHMLLQRCQCKNFCSIVLANFSIE